MVGGEEGGDVCVAAGRRQGRTVAMEEAKHAILTQERKQATVREARRRQETEGRQQEPQIKTPDTDRGENKTGLDDQDGDHTTKRQ